MLYTIVCNGRRFMHYWYEGLPDILHKDRRMRFVLPGLFEQMLPRGVAALDADHFLISLMPTGFRAGNASLLAVMSHKTGSVVRLFEMYRNATHPLVAGVADLEVIKGFKGSVLWTCDDMLDSDPKYAPLGRRNHLIAFDLSDVTDNIPAYVLPLGVLGAHRCAHNLFGLCGVQDTGPADEVGCEGRQAGCTHDPVCRRAR